MTAVAVFATGVGGFFAGLGAFVIFALTMGALVFGLAFIGGSSASVTRSLRTWGRRIQTVSGLVIVLVGIALIYSGIDPGVFDRLILTD